MAKAKISYKKLDWVLIAVYLVLVIFGWMNIYSSSCSDEEQAFSLTAKYGMHLIWIAASLGIAFLIVKVIPTRIYAPVAWPFYLAICFLLVAVAFVGTEFNGSKSWFSLGPIRFQPAEFSKISTSLVLAFVMGKHDFSFKKRLNFLGVMAIILLPILFILLEKETGSALVYLGFLLVFYREGMTGWIIGLGLIAIFLFIMTLVLSPFTTILILIGILAVIFAFYNRRPLITLLGSGALIAALSQLPRLLSVEAFRTVTDRFPPEMWLAFLLVPAALVMAVIWLVKRKRVLRNLMLGLVCGVMMIFSVDFIFEKILQDHQRARIEVLLGIREDPSGVGYNVHQSLVAIGSGGLLGKGFHCGTQTRFDFVPEQSTDFIFCTVGEEWGFVGAMAVLGLYLTLILRLMGSAEKQKDKFTRIYGYCVACCILMHVVINICMTIGLMPVIGIPLPMLSYGGSSLLAFTILLFIYIRLDLNRWRK